MGIDKALATASLSPLCVTGDAKRLQQGEHLNEKTRVASRVVRLMETTPRSLFSPFLDTECLPSFDGFVF